MGRRETILEDIAHGDDANRNIVVDNEHAVNAMRVHPRDDRAQRVHQRHSYDCGRGLVWGDQ